MFKRVCNILDSYCLSQIVSGYTHVSPCGNTSLIDLALTTSPSQIKHCAIIPPLANSDHNGLKLEIEWKDTSSRTYSRRRTIWRYAHADFNKACDLILETDWKAIICERDIEKSWSQWQEASLSIMEKCIPKKVLPPKRHNLPWLNKSMIQSMRRRNALFRRAKRSNNPMHLSQYKHARNKVVSQLRCAKKQFFRNLNPSNTKDFWKSVKYLTKKDSIGTVIHEDHLCKSDLDKANGINAFFSKCFNQSVPPICPTVSSSTEVPTSLLCTESQVYDLLRSLDTSKSSGPDGISARMLKNTARAIAPSITNLFNGSIRCGYPPSGWKTSSVVPIPKKPRAQQSSDFRPISLLPIISKVLERHFFKLINSHLAENHPLSNCQWGFQPGKSTVSALIECTHDWFLQLEKQKEIGAVFFDFRKAFDTVPHQPLLDKLHRLGLDPHITTWIHNYLAERYQKVVLNGECSQVSHVLSGVPQGSILGPLLFLIYIDDITDIALSPESKLVLYADDILLYRTISSRSDFNLLQNDIDAISNWASSNFMTFNESKCKLMQISRKRNPTTPISPLLLNGSQLETVPSFKYLGVLISSDLSWSQHIESVCSKARKILGLIYRRFYHHADTPTLQRLYVSLVRPHLEYVAPIWSPHLLQDINTLESVQKFALRLCGKNWNLGYCELLNLFKLPTLENRRLHLKLCTLFKIVHNLCSFNRTLPLISPYSHNTRCLTFLQPFARTVAFRSSFFPDAISYWNCLPECVVSSPSYYVFKERLRVFTS